MKSETNGEGTQQQNQSSSSSKNEKNLFHEYNQVITLLKTITSNKNDIQNNKSFCSLLQIFDKYLECPTLLDPYMEEIITILSSFVKDIILNYYWNNDNHNQNSSSCVKLPNELYYSLSLIYALCKVRGRKKIYKLLPHDVDLVEPIMSFILSIDNASPAPSSEQSIPPKWESIYTLLLWMNILSLLPFDFNTISETTSTQTTIIDTMIETYKKHLSDSGPTRDIAACCLATIFSRPDLQKEDYINDFLNYFIRLLPVYYDNTEIVVQLELLGILQALAIMYKTSSNRMYLLKHIDFIWIPLLELSNSIFSTENTSSIVLRKYILKLVSRVGCTYLPPRVYSWRYDRGSRRLLSTETTSKIIETKKEVESKDDIIIHNVPNEIEDIINILLLGLQDNSSTIVRWTASKGIGRITERLPNICADDVLDALLELVDVVNDESTTWQDAYRWHGICLAFAELARRGLLLPDRLHEVIPIVLHGIMLDVQRSQQSSIGSMVRDAACYTCWAFARAYDPKILSPFTKQLCHCMVITCVYDREIHCRRAASAAFQEFVGRQGAQNVPYGIDILTTADYYTIGNITNAYTNVAYKIASFNKDYHHAFINHLIKVKLYHWDMNIRILSSKSLFHFFSLDLDFMVGYVLVELVGLCCHEELNVRHGAILGMAEILLALGQEINNDNSNPHSTDNKDISTLLMGDNIDNMNLLSQLVNVVSNIEKARLYRGRGGEIMRIAICRYIECLCLSKLSLTVPQQVQYLDTIDTCLSNPNEKIQQAAVNALYPLTKYYFPVNPATNKPTDRLQKRIVCKYLNLVQTEDNAAITRGFALALGSLPYKLLVPSEEVLENVISCMCRSSDKQSTVGGEGDAETRRNSIISLQRISQTIIHHNNNAGDILNKPKMLPFVFSTLLSSLEDYNTDRRGDVGSWSRIAAMTALKEILITIYDCNNMVIISQELYNQILGSFLKQLAEKLDNVRAHAGSCIQEIVMHISNDNNHNGIQITPQHKHIHGAILSLQEEQQQIERVEQSDIAEEIEEQISNNTIDWSNASITFPFLIKTVKENYFLNDIISGFVISIGGLTQNVVMYATSSFLEWIRVLEDEGNTFTLKQIMEAFMNLFQNHSKDNRVILPLLKTLDKLLSHGCFNSILLAECISNKDNDKTTLATSLVLAIKTETKYCTNVNKLMAIVNVLLSLLSLSDVKLAKEDILPLFIPFLSHRYPRIRRYTAEQFYIQLLEFEGDCSSNTLVPSISIGIESENKNAATGSRSIYQNDVSSKLLWKSSVCQSIVQQVMDLLLTITWDDVDKVDIVRQSRTKIATLLDVILPSTIMQNGNGRNKVKRVSNIDDFENYSSLIKDLNG